MATTDIPPRPGSGAARRQAAAKRKSREKSKGPWMLVGGLVAVIAVVLVVALVVSGGDDDTSVSTGGASGLLQQRPITVEGEALAPEPDSGVDAAIGATVPTVNGQTFNGVNVSVPVKGTPTLIVVMAHWCPHCQKEIPMMAEWEKAGNFPDGIEVVGVSTGYKPDLIGTSSLKVIEEPSQWLADEGFPFAVIADSEGAEAAGALGVTGYPTMMMVDADGKLAWRISGEVPMENLTSMIQGTLDSAAIPQG
ncbi:MAG: TlpA disulfide reductase family protein [Ilumatobacteraceae bacterium]